MHSVILNIIYFPIWWYSRGLILLLIKLKNFLSNREKSLAFFVWIKNIHRPMYGQNNWEGILISFFMRLIQIIIRGIIMLFWSGVSLGIIFFWLVLPVLTIYEIIIQMQ